MKHIGAHRIKAAERDTSVSALVKAFLMELGETENNTERLKREERALREQISGFEASRANHGKNFTSGISSCAFSRHQYIFHWPTLP